MNSIASEIFPLLEKDRAHRVYRTQMDDIKFLFQALLGPGHLLSDPEGALAYLRSEMENCRCEPSEPLIEPLSRSWCRLNLRAARSRGIPSEQIFNYMLAGNGDCRYSRSDVYEACMEFILPDHPSEVFRESCERVLDASFLPSHSDIYRLHYQPAYRVIPTGLTE